MWPYTALKKAVTVEKKMVGSDGSPDVSIGRRDVFCGFLGGYMFEYDFKVWQFLAKGYQDFVDEDGFPVKNVDGWVTSPCMSNGMPCFCISSRVTMQLSSDVTPASELVVAPAG